MPSQVIFTNSFSFGRFLLKFLKLFFDFSQIPLQIPSRFSAFNVVVGYFFGGLGLEVI